MTHSCAVSVKSLVLSIGRGKSAWGRDVDAGCYARFDRAGLHDYYQTDTMGNLRLVSLICAVELCAFFIGLGILWPLA